jgi:hypothetical protein
MAIPGLNLPRAGESYSGSQRSANFEGLAERMTEVQRKKRKKDEEERLQATAAADKQKADEKAKADKEAEAKKNSLPNKIARGIADIWQADSEDDKRRRVEAGQPALYKDQQAEKKQTADAFRTATGDEFGRADDGLNLSKEEFAQRRSHYQAAGIDVDQLQRDKAEYDAVQAKLKAGRTLVDLTKKGEITEGAKRYEQSKLDIRKAESTYQRTLKAEAGAESGLEQVERGFVRGMGKPLIEAPSSAQTMVGSALKAVAPEGSRVQQAGEAVYERGKEHQQSLAEDIVRTGYGAYDADNPTVRAFSEGAGSLAAALTAAKMFRSTSAPAATFGVNQAADQNIGSQEAGKGEVQAFLTGAGAGTVEGLLEKVGLDKFLGAKGSVVKKVSTRMLTEGLQEATQSLSQSGFTATYDEVELQQAIQQALTEGGIGALIGGGAGLPMAIAENLQAKGVDPNTALETGMNVQDRIESIIQEEKGSEAEAQPQAVPDGQEAGVSQSAVDDTLPGQSITGDTPIGASPQKGQSADQQLEQVRLRYPKTEDLPDAAKADETRTLRGGTQPLFTKTDIKVIAKAIPGLKANPVLTADKDAEGNTIFTFKDGQNNLKLKASAVGINEERLAAAGVVPGTEIDLSEAIKTPAGAGSAPVIRRGGTDYLAASDEAQDAPQLPTQATPSSSPAPKYDIAGQQGTGSQIPNEQTNNELVALLNQQQQVITNKLIAAKKTNNTQAMAEAVDELESVNSQIQRATVASNETQSTTEQNTSQTSQRTGGDSVTASGDGSADSRQYVRERPASRATAASGATEKTVGAPSAAAGGRVVSDGRPGAESRAPVAGGASGTIKGDELHAGDQNSNQGDQSGRAAAGSSRPGSGQSTGKDAVAAADSKTPSDRNVGSSESRQRILKAIENHKALSEGRESERPAEEMAKLAQQLNKAAQAGAILRRGDLKSKKAAGMFTRKGGDGKDPKTAKDPRIMLKDAVIQDPQQYATVLAHELSHAMEFYITGNTSKTLSMFDLTAEERTTVTNELKRIVDEIEGADVAQSNPKYFYSPTEMLARYVEMTVLFPGKAETMAPLLSQKFDELVVREPMIQDLFDAVEGNIDKGYVNWTPYKIKDLRQIYRYRLGKHVGDIAYNAEMVRRAEIQRSQQLIGDLIKRKFKGIKDDPAALFRAAEAVLITENGQPQFGTHDFLWDVSERDLEKSLKAGYQVVEKKPKPTDKQIKQLAAGEEVAEGDIKYEYDLSKVRYTPQQAEEIFKKLSPAGQQLVKDFTAAKEEAKDEFNRELMKDLYKIDSKVEGWVHHYFEDRPMGNNNKASLRHKVAAAKKQRKNADGYVEDFQKAIEKAMLEMDRNEINNGFIRDQLARISKPIAKGEKPEKGWVEVVADEKGGLRLPGEGMQIIIKPDEGKAVKIPQKRYQVPEDLVKHYREIRDVPGEVSAAAKWFNRAAKYWTLNVLIHPGTVSTNFISGGLQYGAKIMNDFYMDLLTANFGMSRTRHNLIAPLLVLTPRGWTNAPDWLYGGFRSGTQGGQMANMTGDDRFDRSLDAYGDKMLKAMGLVETYWKKTIALSEGSKLSDATNRRITERLHKDELKMVAALNEAIDAYAFDYDNRPLWLTQFERRGGKFVKPFMTYPYKYTKFITGMAAAGFDRSLPWQTRVSKVLTLTTVVAAIAMMYDDREEKQTTPKGTEKTPLSLIPGGRLFIGTAQDGKELFVRTAKYPFFNLTSLGRAAADRNGKEVSSLLNEMFATVGPGFDLFMMATGRADQFDQYAPVSKRLGELVGSYIPGFRVLNDAGKMIDEKQRKPETFIQGVASQLPIWGSEEQRTKLRGDVRTIKIPDEPEDGRELTKTTRTVTEREMTNNRNDVLLSLLTGVYIRRIDPKEAKQQELREIRDDAETKIRDLLKAGNEADAETMAEEYGFQISNDTLKYYRRKESD